MNAQTLGEISLKELWEMTDDAKETSKKKEEPFHFLYILLVSVALIWAISGMWVYNLFDKWDDRGTFGDMFGAINSLFSGLAFAGVIYTIYLQRKELSIQREEISKSTRELEGQKNLMDLQKFENKFFQLVNLHHEIVRSFNSGRALFQNVNTIVFNKLPKQNVTLNMINDAYIDTFNKHKIELGHYFRNLYHIVKFIDSTQELSEFSARYTYVRILRAQLSTYEIVLLAYNGISKHGKEFKILIEKYKLLKNIDFNDNYLVGRELLFEQYPHLKEAFEEQCSIFIEETNFA